MKLQTQVPGLPTNHPMLSIPGDLPKMASLEFGKYLNFQNVLKSRPN